MRQAAAGRVDVTVHAPPSTTAREARIYVDVLDEGNVIGELAAAIAVGGKSR